MNASMVWMVDAEQLPSQRCNDVSISPGASVAGDRQRRAAALASTSGKCLWRASTTTTASRRESSAVSVKARAELLASLTCSGDVAIRSYSGLSKPQPPVYTPRYYQEYPALLCE